MSHKIQCDMCGKEMDLTRDNYWTLDANLYLTTGIPEQGDEIVMGGVPYHFCSLDHLAIWATGKVLSGQRKD